MASSCAFWRTLTSPARYGLSRSRDIKTRAVFLQIVIATSVLKQATGPTKFSLIFRCAVKPLKTGPGTGNGGPVSLGSWLAPEGLTHGSVTGEPHASAVIGMSLTLLTPVLFFIGAKSSSARLQASLRTAFGNRRAYTVSCLI